MRADDEQRKAFLEMLLRQLESIRQASSGNLKSWTDRKAFSKASVLAEKVRAELAKMRR